MPGIPVEVIEARVDCRMENVVFVDGIVYERYKDSEYVLSVAAGSHPGPIRSTLFLGELPPVRETFRIRPSESMDEAKARWREQAMADAIYIESWHLLTV